MKQTPRTTSNVQSSSLLGLWLAVLAAGFSAALGMTEPVSAVGGFLYDAATRLAARSQSQSPAEEILLVRAELRAQAFDDSYWLSLLHALLAAEPKRVAFMNMPEAVSPDFYAAAAESQRVVFGRTRVFEANDLGYTGLAHPPAAAEGYELPFGIVETPPTRWGVYRAYRTAYPLAGQPLSSFAAAVAFDEDTVKQRRRYARRGEIMVNFVTAGGPLPAVSADRILSGDWSSDFVRDRTVIVGFVDDTYLPKLRTPLDRTNDQLSTLEAQGYATLTLLRGVPVRSLPPWAGFVLLLAVCISQLYVYRHLGLRAAAGVTVAMPLVYGLGAALVLRALLWWLPLVELALAQLTLWSLLLLRRAHLHKQRMSDIAERVERRAVQPERPLQALSASDPWDSRVHMLNQTLELTRFIFLALSADGKRLHEVKAFQCSVEEIQEQRRDPARPPYNNLLDDAAVPLESAFFKSSAPGEQVYMVPLRSEGRLLGFWAFGIDAQRAASLPLFAVCVHDYAAQIAQLMVQEQFAELAKKRSWLRRAFSIEADVTEETRLEAAHGQLGSRLRLLEDLVETLDTATVVYDLFGHPRLINEAMTKLASRAGIDLAGLDALHFTMAVARLGESDARRWLRNVAVHRASFNTMIQFGQEGDIFAMLRARPLLQRVDAELGEADAVPFRLRGIMFEIVDATALRRLYDLKDELLHTAGAMLPEEVQKVIRAAATLDNPNLPPGHRERLAKLTVEKMASAVQQLVTLDRVLQEHSLQAGPACYALDPLPVLQNALSAVHSTALRSRARLRVELGNEHRTVFAELPALEGVFGAVLNALVVSAPPDSEIQVFSKSDAVQVLQSQRLTFWFVNERRGVDDAELQRWLAGEGQFGADFRALRSAMRTVENWGGALECVAVAEAGITFRLRLRGFL